MLSQKNKKKYVKKFVRHREVNAYMRICLDVIYLSYPHYSRNKTLKLRKVSHPRSLKPLANIATGKCESKHGDLTRGLLKFKWVEAFKQFPRLPLSGPEHVAKECSETRQESGIWTPVLATQCEPMDLRIRVSSFAKQCYAIVTSFVRMAALQYIWKEGKALICSLSSISPPPLLSF